MSEEQSWVAEQPPDPFNVDSKHKTGPRYEEPLFYRESPAVPQAPGLSGGRPIIGIWCSECCKREDPDYCPYGIKRKMEADSKKRVFVPDPTAKRRSETKESYPDEETVLDGSRIDSMDREIVDGQS